MPHLGQPGILGTIVKSIPGRDVVNDRLNELERIVKQLTVARSADYATVGANGTFKIDGALITTGNAEIGGTTTLNDALTLASGATLTASGDVMSSNYVAGVSGWKLDGTTGNLEINDATIRGGIIGDPSLANPVNSQAVAGGSVLSLTFTSSFASYITKTITVPTGYTRAIVYATTVATALSAGAAAVEARTEIDGVAGPTVVGAGNTGEIAVAPFSAALSGLSGGGMFTIEAQALDGSSSLAPGSGGISLNGFVLFLS